MTETDALASPPLQMYKWGGCDIHVFDPTVDFDRVAPKLKAQVG
jgi:hypothetical protein